MDETIGMGSCGGCKGCVVMRNWGQGGHPLGAVGKRSAGTGIPFSYQGGGMAMEGLLRGDGDSAYAQGFFGVEMGFLKK